MDMKSVTRSEDALESAPDDPHVRALRELGHALDAHALLRPCSLTAELRAGLQHLVRERAFTLHYQAIVDAHRHVVGVEALARMAHPERGILPPAEFVPHLERTGDVMVLGEWVLSQACEQLARWSTDPAYRHLYIAVNISARHFQAEQFVPTVLELLGSHNLGICRLRIEITESALLTDVPQAIHKMQVLKGSGVTFAIDDFGTGYSSLAYLRRLPIDVIKLDRSFIQDMVGSDTANTIVRAVLELARALDVATVAEGVETDEQFECLRHIGCPNFQGFLFGRPHPDIQAVIAGKTGLSTDPQPGVPGLSATMPLFHP